MRPPRADIAVPQLPGRIRWLNAARAPDVAALTAGGPLLVHFFDFAQLNSVRALPYLLEWRERYEQHGLAVLGVHSPRFAFTGRREALAAGLRALGVEHPVADDRDYAIWHDYGCRGWPSLFLWGRGGALRWVHFGEGEYQASEEAIQEELLAHDVTLALPDPLDPLRPTDAPGVLVELPTEELFPGGSPAEPWDAAASRDVLELDYEAGAAYVVADGDGELRVAVDGRDERRLALAPHALHLVAEHPRHEHHRLRVTADRGVRIWAFSFAAGLP